MSTPLRVLIVTDSFPPNCGGSGWSTYELSRGLRERGHHVDILRVRTSPQAGAQITHEQYEGLPVTVFRKRAPTTPLVRNVVKNERLWADLDAYLRRQLTATPYDIVHAQHVMTTVPSIRAARAMGVPVVATVRDYWPVCYWSDLIYDPASPDLCPECTPGQMTRCVRPRSGAAWPAAVAAIPYMRANLRTKRETLGQADAIVAVSHAIARDLRTRAPNLAGTPMYTVPNPVDMRDLVDAHDHAEPPGPGPYVLYAGKIATNKGVQFLLPALQEAGIRWPIVIVGDGPLRESIAREAQTRGLDVRVLGWLPRREVLAWMRHAAFLAFPSYGPESLSRVLIEAAALGTPIAAMDTGGTRDILTPGVTGLVSADRAAFAADLATLAGDARLRAALGHAALADVRVRFDARLVCERIEQIYRTLLLPSAA